MMNQKANDYDDYDEYDDYYQSEAEYDKQHPCNGDDDDEGICPSCSGSGEGMYEGQTCSRCKGKGIS